MTIKDKAKKVVTKVDEVINNGTAITATPSIYFSATYTTTT
jgi:hypothetical protein